MLGKEMLNLVASGGMIDVTITYSSDTGSGKIKIVDLTSGDVILDDSRVTEISTTITALVEVGSALDVVTTGPYLRFSDPVGIDLISGEDPCSVVLRVIEPNSSVTVFLTPWA